MMRRIVAAGRRWGSTLLLAATIFSLWDGRTLLAKEWILHGDEYVVTLPDGTTIILRQQEVRELTPAAEGPGPVPGR